MKNLIFYKILREHKKIDFCRVYEVTHYKLLYSRAKYFTRELQLSIVDIILEARFEVSNISICLEIVLSVGNIDEIDFDILSPPTSVSSTILLVIPLQKKC